MAIQHWDRMDNEKLIIKVEPKVFVMNTLRNLVLRLNYKQSLDLGLTKPGADVQCLHYSCSTREKRKGPEVLKKGGNIC